MTGSRTGAHWIAGLAGLAAVCVGVWLLLAEGSERGDVAMPETGAAGTSSPATTSSEAPPRAAAAGPRIASGGRLGLDADALPTDAPLGLTLELDDAARAPGEHAVRVVSEDGRRVDLVAAPLPGPGSGLRLEIDPAFLSPGLYMIEVDTAEAHPLHIRRYVLEIR